MSLADKIRNVQSKIKPIVRDATNPFFKSKYFDINAILAELKPLLLEEKITVLQPLSWLNGYNAEEKRQEIITAIQTILLADDERMEFICPLPYNPDPQKMGAIITYFRRYALQSLFLLEAEDTDAENTRLANKPIYSAGATTREDVEKLFVTNSPLVPYSPQNDAQKQCPKCSKWHGGKFPKCLECWKAENPR